MRKAAMLAQVSRRGVRRLGSHPLERLAFGQPLSDAAARQAIDETFAEIGRMFRTDLGDGDVAWQVRDDLARSVPAVMPARWLDLLDIVDDKPERAEPERDLVRDAFAGIVHAMGGSAEAVADDFIAAFGVFGGLPEEAVEQMLREQREAELRGDPRWERVMEDLSIRRIRQLARDIDVELWRRALAVHMMVVSYQTMVIMVGALAIAGTPTDLGAHLHIDAAAVRRLQADPMWHVVGQFQLSTKCRRRVREMALGALAIIMSGEIDAWEAYRDRLLAIIHPVPHGERTDVRKR